MGDGLKGSFVVGEVGVYKALYTVRQNSSPSRNAAAPLYLFPDIVWIIQLSPIHHKQQMVYDSERDVGIVVICLYLL